MKFYFLIYFWKYWFTHSSI